jgi:hypothetical protein
LTAFILKLPKVFGVVDSPIYKYLTSSDVSLIRVMAYAQSNSVAIYGRHAGPRSSWTDQTVAKFNGYYNIEKIERKDTSLRVTDREVHKEEIAKTTAVQICVDGFSEGEFSEDELSVDETPAPVAAELLVRYRLRRRESRHILRRRHRGRCLA